MRGRGQARPALGAVFSCRSPWQPGSSCLFTAPEPGWLSPSKDPKAPACLRLAPARRSPARRCQVAEPTQCLGSKGCHPAQEDTEKPLRLTGCSCHSPESLLALLLVWQAQNHKRAAPASIPAQTLHPSHPVPQSLVQMLSFISFLSSVMLLYPQLGICPR